MTKVIFLYNLSGMKNINRAIKTRDENDKIPDRERRRGMRPEVRAAFEIALKRHDGALKLLADCDAGKISRPRR